MEYIDNYYSNEDVKNAKPKAEIYLKCMIDAGFDPKECLIIEDSYVGRKAALASGAFLCGVMNTSDVTYENIMDSLIKLITILSILNKNGKVVK